MHTDNTQPQTFTLSNGKIFTLSYDNRGLPIITMDTITTFQIVFRNVHTTIHLGSEAESEIYTYALQDESKEDDIIQSLYLEHINYNVVEHVLLDCAYGIYTPCEFVKRYFDQLTNKEDFNRFNFDDPDSEYYWSDWNLLLDNARIEIEGRTCYLSYNEHTNDLCAYPIIVKNHKDKTEANENI